MGMRSGGWTGCVLQVMLQATAALHSHVESHGWQAGSLGSHLGAINWGSSCRLSENLKHGGWGFRKSLCDTHYMHGLGESP